MRTARKTIELVPSARRLIESLRDMGYEVNSAVADVVDNSIAAGSTQVAIDLHFEGAHSWLRIADNGSGMDPSELTEAMRYGAHQDYEDGTLGKFGLGLKTASMSQCQKLTVATRKQKTHKVEVRRWDLQHIEKTDRWEVLDLDAHSCSEFLTGPLDSRPGTVVLWERLDRMMAYKIPDGERAKKGFLAMAAALEHHLAMVFHRFLSGEARRRKRLTISVNGNPLEHWDPFCRTERATESVGERTVELETPIGSGIVVFRGYVLPSKSRFSTEEAWTRASGPKKWNHQQGLYIYREDRLIKCGGWFGYRTIDEHLKCARASIDFSRHLDAPFKVNVSKLRAELPQELLEQLGKSLQVLLKKAKSKYDGDDTPAPITPRGLSPLPSAVTSPQASPASSRVSALAPTRAPSPPPRKMAREALEAAVERVGERRAWSTILQDLKKHDGDMARELGY